MARCREVLKRASPFYYKPFVLCRRLNWFIQDLNAGQIIPTNVTPCFFYVMTVEELLKQRYKVVALYFYSPYKIGDIITLDADRSIHLTTIQYRDEFGETINQENRMSPLVIQDYPHLFKSLDWWEDRKRDELPEYVKNKFTGKVRKVKSYSINPYMLVVNVELEKVSDSWFMELRVTLPATLEEYEAQRSTKQIVTK